jgi:hypothetical protein
MDRAKAWLDARGTDLHRYGMERDGLGSPKPRRRVLSCRAVWPLVKRSACRTK